MNKAHLNIAIRHLRKSDPQMAALIKQCDPITYKTHTPPHYHALVNAIINQQLSVKAAATIQQRLLDKHGGRYFKADIMLKLKATAIRECGLSNKKVLYVRSLAQAIIKGDLNFRSLTRQADDKVREILTVFPGIGPWSADMFLISSLQRPDIFPVGDLVIRQTMQRFYGTNQGSKQVLHPDSKHDIYISIADAWRPYRSIASLYLWKSNSLSS